VRDLAALRALRTALTRRSPDVFHANLNAPWSCRYAILVARTMPHVRRVAVEQLVLPMPQRRTRVVKRLTSKMLDAHVAVGDASARTLEHAIRRPRGSVRTIHNGVADEPQRCRRVGASPCVVTLARLDPVKGLDVLIDALQDLPGVEATVAGEGSERASLVRRAAERRVLDRVHLVGWDSRARELLGGGDLFVLPSREEGLPLSIAEAMLAARAVVASDVGSVREIVDDGVTGILVPADDPGALARAIAELLADDARRTEMGRRGRERALACFTAPRMASDFEALYTELTGWQPSERVA
jgi:glycosyltransferase involved in cell wall biosynthesis